MKMSILSMLVSSLMISTANAYTGFGICNFGDETVSAVICEGPSVLKGTTVLGDLRVTGPLTAEKVSAQSLTITGSVDVQNSKVTGNVNVTGNFRANGVEFRKGLNLTSDSVLLHKVKVKGSVAIHSSSNTPYLTMECTSIRGDVTFTGKAGILKITDDSVVQGKVINGSMIFLKSKC